MRDGDPFGPDASTIRVPDVKAWPIFHWSWTRFALVVVGALWALAMVRGSAAWSMPLGAAFTVLAVADHRQQAGRARAAE